MRSEWRKVFSSICWNVLSGIKWAEILEGRTQVRDYGNNWALSSKLLQEG